MQNRRNEGVLHRGVHPRLRLASAAPHTSSREPRRRRGEAQARKQRIGNIRTQIPDIASTGLRVLSALVCAATVMSANGSDRLGGHSLRNAAVAQGAPEAPQDHSGASAQLTADRFLALAGSGGMAEVELSRIAKERSGNDAVRKFADQMIRDHSTAHAELQSIISTRPSRVASTLTETQRAAIATLRSQDDVAQLNRMYATQMVKDHQETVNLFAKAEAQPNMDSNIREYARRMLPVLKQHLEDAKLLSTQFGTLEEQQRSR